MDISDHGNPEDNVVTTTNNEDDTSFGQSSQEKLTRCLCILDLNQFGDYSGPSILTMQSGNNGGDNARGGCGGDYSGATIAPVREPAAQVIICG